MALVKSNYIMTRINDIIESKLSEDNFVEEILNEETLEDAVCILAGVLVTNYETQKVFESLLGFCASDNEKEAENAEPAAGRAPKIEE